MGERLERGGVPRGQGHGRPAAEAVDEAASVLFTLTSFETFDTLAGAERGIAEMVPVVQRLAWAALGLEGAALPSG